MPTLYTETGRRYSVKPKRPRYGFTLEELYNLLKCKTIQIVGPNKNGILMICDEEGKIRTDRKPVVNEAGTKWMWEHFRVNDTVVGRVLFCGSRFIK